MDVNQLVVDVSIRIEFSFYKFFRILKDSFKMFSPFG